MPYYFSGNQFIRIIIVFGLPVEHLVQIASHRFFDGIVFWYKSLSFQQNIIRKVELTDQFNADPFCHVGDVEKIMRYFNIQWLTVNRYGNYFCFIIEKKIVVNNRL